MTVLYSYSETTLSGISYLLILILAVVGLSNFYMWTSKKFYKKTRMIVSAICGFVAILMVLGVVRSWVTTKYIECVINEDYSATKLYDNYNVISKRGDIWVLSFKHPGDVKEEKDD